jgi:small subunit ribosomal protein S20
MPNIKSAKKRLRQSLVRRARNRSAKSELKTRIRKVLELIKAGNAAEAETAYRLTVKKLDQAAAAKIIHSNRADRVKSRLSHRLKIAKNPAPAA